MEVDMENIPIKQHKLELVSIFREHTKRICLVGKLCSASRWTQPTNSQTIYEKIWSISKWIGGGSQNG